MGREKRQKRDLRGPRARRRAALLPGLVGLTARFAADYNRAVEPTRPRTGGCGREQEVPMTLDAAQQAALRLIHARLQPHPLVWAITGSLGLALQGMPLDVHDIDLQTDAQGAYAIQRLLADFVVEPVREVVSERIRSHLGRLRIHGVAVEVMGGVQKRRPGQAWGPPTAVARHRRWVAWEGRRLPVLDLAYEEAAYAQLGRLGKAAAIRLWRTQRVSLRPFRPADQRAAQGLILAAMQERWGTLDPGKNPDLNDIASSYADGVFLVACQEGALVATGAFRPHAADTVEIVRMAVRRDRRRRGIGRAMLWTLCWRAYRAGYRRAILETTAHWHDAVAFYRAFGFRITHRAGEDVYFALDLPAFFAAHGAGP